MNTISRVISGGAMILIGAFLFIESFFWKSIDNIWISISYGFIIFVLGLVLIFNKDEDKIEQIKKKGYKKK